MRKKYQDRIGLAEYTINQNLDDILKGIYRDHPEVFVHFLLYLEYFLCEESDPGSA